VNKVSIALSFHHFTLEITHVPFIRLEMIIKTTKLYVSLLAAILLLAIAAGFLTEG